MACLMDMGFRLAWYVVTRDVTPVIMEIVSESIVDTSGVSTETAA